MGPKSSDPVSGGGGGGGLPGHLSEFQNAPVAVGN